jgi:hypothetical protein
MGEEGQNILLEKKKFIYISSKEEGSFVYNVAIKLSEKQILKEKEGRRSTFALMIIFKVLSAAVNCLCFNGFPANCF